MTEVEISSCVDCAKAKEKQNDFHNDPPVLPKYDWFQALFETTIQLLYDYDLKTS